MKTVYMCFSTDILHSGHIAIIRRAAALGELTVGVLTDEAIATYKRYPLIPLSERMQLFECLSGVHRVVAQRTLSYRDALTELKPDILVHGDDWRTGVQCGVRAEAIAVLKSYGGELVEFPYTHSATEETLTALDSRLNMPEVRRGRLRRLLQLKPCLSVMEAHNGLTGLIVENAAVSADGGVKRFDAMWVSSLCDSTAKGKPDIELVDWTSRIHTLEEIMEVTSKPIILDGDTGGLTEHFTYNLRTLERVGVSAVIIEDKIGLKKNSLFGAGAQQKQATVEEFCEKLSAGKKAQRSKDFMIFARCESLILEQGMDDALSRCRAYVQAGADGVMIHSCQKTPDEVYGFLARFRETNPATPVVVVPTTYNGATEAELAAHGANVVIHANHLLRSAFPAMLKTAELTLQNGRTREADELCMSIRDILTLIPTEEP
ncbi:MAG TPA: phosphoenolpyruvate mutase [Candidatus Limiplasma sp.]|nr:phosphoenolpyruvate mutase [Candidatus Limiplasma sp.]